jgi:ribosomal protein S21
MIKDSCVVIVENNDVASALRVFKRQAEASGVMREMRKRESYAKPSVRRVTKSRMARAKVRKAAQRTKAWLEGRQSSSHPNRIGGK